MAWWQWVVVGAVLLGTEMFVDAEFYLVFLGISAVCVGLLGLGTLGLPIWAQWLLFAGLAVLSLVVFRRRLYRKLRGKGADLDEGVVGETAIAIDDIGPHGTGRAELRGSQWAARNAGADPIPAGGRARVESLSGFTITLRLVH